MKEWLATQGHVLGVTIMLWSFLLLYLVGEWVVTHEWRVKVILSLIAIGGLVCIAAALARFLW